MDLQILNKDLFNRLSLAIVIIRNTPSGIKPDVFTRCLVKRLFPKKTKSHLMDEHLILRQHDILSRSHSRMPTSMSLMDIVNSTIEIDEKQEKSVTPYEYGEFAKKVFKLKMKQYQINIDDIEYLLNFLIKWIGNENMNDHLLPIDSCLYTIQLIANIIKTDTDKPYHILLDILPIIDKFIDTILNLIEHVTDKNLSYLHQIIVSLSSSNSCISRILDKLCMTICQCSEATDVFIHDYDRRQTTIERLFNIIHEIITNRCIFQQRLSQRAVDKIINFINHVSKYLDGKPNFKHLLKLEGQLQAGNYSFKMAIKQVNVDYSINQYSQSQYFLS